MTRRRERLLALSLLPLRRPDDALSPLFAAPGHGAGDPPAGGPPPEEQRPPLLGEHPPGPPAIHQGSFLLSLAPSTRNFVAPCFPLSSRLSPALDAQAPSGPLLCCIKKHQEALIAALAAPAKPLRATAGTAAAAIVTEQESLVKWPQLVSALAAAADGSRGADAQDGALDTLYKARGTRLFFRSSLARLPMFQSSQCDFTPRGADSAVVSSRSYHPSSRNQICEEVPQLLERDCPELGARPADLLVPRLVALFPSGSASVRRLSLGWRADARRTAPRKAASCARLAPFLLWSEEGLDSALRSGSLNSAPRGSVNMLAPFMPRALFAEMDRCAPFFSHFRGRVCISPSLLRLCLRPR